MQSPVSPRIRRFAPIALAALCLLFAVHAALAEGVWKWVDKNGVPHYSDQPTPGAVRVDLNVQTYDSAAATIPPGARPTQPKPAAAPVPYQLIEIWKPGNDQAIVGSGGEVSVAVRVEPEVQAGHSLRLELNGARVSEPSSTATTFELKNIPRGTHTLAASVVTGAGQTLIQATPVTFHVLQPVVKRP